MSIPINVHIESGQLLIRAFAPSDLERFADIATDILGILSDEKTLRYIPEKKLCGQQDAESYLKGLLLGHYTGKNLFHFIIRKDSSEIIGLFYLFSPEVSRGHYQLSDACHFIEFFLSSKYSGCYIMTNVLPLITSAILSQGVPKLAAVVNRNNLAAKKVLQKSSFRYSRTFDSMQDLFETGNLSQA